MSSPPAPATAPSAIQLEPTSSAPASITSTWTSLRGSPTIKDNLMTRPFPPMTTHWSRPMSCTWTYIVDSKLQPGASAPIAWLDLEPIPGAKTLSCYPDGMFFDGRTGIFSPGTCPYGWTTVSLQVNTNEPRTDATTTALCCSSEYSLEGGHCKRLVPTVLAVPIIYNHTAATFEVLSNSTTTLYSATIAVNTIRALFQEVDKKALGLTDESEIDNEPQFSNGLSLSARIGIGIAVPVLSLLIIGTLVFVFLRRQRHRRRREKEHNEHNLECMRRRRRLSTSSSIESPRPSTRQTTTEPPPAYQAATETNSPAEDDAAADSVASREEEMKILMAQKAVIQRRIEELERGETAASSQ